MNTVCASQIGFADRILLTKTDAIDALRKEFILSRLNTINAKADIFGALNGALPKEVWIGINAFDLSDSLKLNQGFFCRCIEASALTFTSFSQNAPKQSWNDDISILCF